MSALAFSRARVSGALLIVFAKIHLVEVPHSNAEEVPRDGPNNEIYRDVSNVINRAVRESWLSHQILCGDYEEHESAPLQDSYAQGEALFASDLRFLPMLLSRLTWWLQSAVPLGQIHGNIVEQPWAKFNTNVPGRRPNFCPPGWGFPRILGFLERMSQTKWALAVCGNQSPNHFICDHAIG